jgi:hypothetical protein
MCLSFWDPLDLERLGLETGLVSLCPKNPNLSNPYEELH